MKILNFVKSIGLEILIWRQYHEKFLCLRTFVVESLNRLHWTPQGTVDEKKTAEALIKDENLDIAARYKLACHYCLETDIRELWSKLPQNFRKCFYDENPARLRQRGSVIFWTYYIKGEVAKVYNLSGKRWQRRCTSSYQYQFEVALCCESNKTATRYFLQKLNPKERAESLIRCTEEMLNCNYESEHSNSNCAYPRKYDANVLCFVLSQMNEEEQTELFRNCRCKVLGCFLNWPWQNLFMGVANSMWAFFSEDDYFNILRKIADKVREGHKDYDYQTLFGEVWQHIPPNHKRYVADECITARFLIIGRFFEVRDVKNIKLILKDATPLCKKELISSGIGKCICEHLVYGDDWHLLEFFIGECISTKLEIMSIKAKFKELPTIKGDWDKFFQLLDDFICRYDKRKSLEEGDSSPAKKKKS